jgi:hypothetical protein
MNYYVYTLAHNDTVFYVGKGCGSRIKQHEQEALRGHNCPKCALIRSIWRSGGSVQRAIVFETEDERAALDREAELIQHYGLAQLVNRTRGGQPGRRRRIVRSLATADCADRVASSCSNALLNHRISRALTATSAAPTTLENTLRGSAGCHCENAAGPSGGGSTFGPGALCCIARSALLSAPANTPATPTRRVDPPGRAAHPKMSKLRSCVRFDW